MELSVFEEQIFFATVRIAIDDKANKNSSIGTGFLFSAPIKDSGRSVVLLISNRHVYGDGTQSITLNFHKKNSDGSGPDLGQIVTIAGDEFQNIYFPHPDPEIDLACTNVSSFFGPKFNIYYKSLNPNLCGFPEDKLYAGADVWFIGYPDNRFDTSHNLPILRRGFIASLPQVDFENKKQFIIDAQVFGGSSGSPVFTVINNKFGFIGVVTQAMIRGEILQTIPTAMSYIKQPLGLGIVIKASIVHELIDHVVNKIHESIKNEGTEQAQIP